LIDPQTLTDCEGLMSEYDRRLNYIFFSNSTNPSFFGFAALQLVINNIL